MADVDYLQRMRTGEPVSSLMNVEFPVKRVTTVGMKPTPKYCGSHGLSAALYSQVLVNPW